MAKKKLTIKERVHRYIDGVLAGKIPAGKHLKAACQRHLDDLKNQKRKGIYFDEAIAARAIEFAPLLKHSTGEYANKPFKLYPFQMFITWVLFGWRSASDGMRRFRRAFISMASGNGKSPFAAFILVLCIFFDTPPEPDAHGYVVSTKVSQCKPVFEEIKKFVRQDRNLASLITILNHNINCPLTGSKIEKLGSGGTVDDGLVPHCVVYDEIHRAREHHRETLAMIKAKLGKRRQPLMLIITTAGSDQSVLWEEEYDMARKVVERGNNIEADDLFVYITQIDEGDDPFDEANWAKANPMLEHGIVKIKALRSDMATAKLDRRKLSENIRLRMNRRVTSAVKPITTEMWASGNLPLPPLDGLECHAGLDLGFKRDLAAVTYVFPLDSVEIGGELKPRVAVLCDAFIPADCERNLAEEPWCKWIEDEHLTLTPGAVTDVETIYAKIEERQKTFGIRTMALDPNNARAPGTYIETHLGIKSFWHGQGFQKMNEPTRELLDMLHEGRLIHGGNPLLAWCALNLVLQTNDVEYVRPSKRHAKEKIDPIVALIMGINEVLYKDDETPTPTGRVYSV